MKNIHIPVLFLCSGLYLTTCLRAPEYPIEPQLAFKAMSRQVLNQGAFNNDSLLVQLTFTDGDGDIGSNDSLSLFFIDTRTNEQDPVYRLPFVPEEDAGRGISGTISVVLYSTCCLFADGSPPCSSSSTQPTDTLQYRVYMTDRAGHISPEVELPPIVLVCN
jgi:hypothetical protein